MTRIAERRRTLTDHLLRMGRARSIEEVWGLHVEHMRGHGFDGLLYAATKFRDGENLGDLSDALVLTTQGPRFTKVYIDGGLYRESPMVRWSLHNEGLLPWSEIRRWQAEGTLSPAEERILAFNAQHGVQVGFGVAFRPATYRSAAGIGLSTSCLTQDEVDDLLALQGRDLHLANVMMHLAVSALPRRGLLSARQREALRLVAEGKSTRDASEIMGISVSMVEKHLRDGRARLNVDTTAQAVAKAALQNQVLWYPDGPEEPATAAT